jgi:hypothetical protein
MPVKETPMTTKTKDLIVVRTLSVEVEYEPDEETLVEYAEEAGYDVDEETVMQLDEDVLAKFAEEAFEERVVGDLDIQGEILGHGDFWPG